MRNRNDVTGIDFDEEIKVSFKLNDSKYYSPFFEVAKELNEKYNDVYSSKEDAENGNGKISFTTKNYDMGNDYIDTYKVMIQFNQPVYKKETDVTVTLSEFIPRIPEQNTEINYNRDANLDIVSEYIKSLYQELGNGTGMTVSFKDGNKISLKDDEVNKLNRKIYNLYENLPQEKVTPPRVVSHFNDISNNAAFNPDKTINRDCYVNFTFRQGVRMFSDYDTIVNNFDMMSLSGKDNNTIISDGKNRMLHMEDKFGKKDVEAFCIYGLTAATNVSNTMVHLDLEVPDDSDERIIRGRISNIRPISNNEFTEDKVNKGVSIESILGYMCCLDERLGDHSEIKFSFNGDNTEFSINPAHYTQGITTGQVRKEIKDYIKDKIEFTPPDLSASVESKPKNHERQS